MYPSAVCDGANPCFTHAHTLRLPLRAIRRSDWRVNLDRSVWNVQSQGTAP